MAEALEWFQCKECGRRQRWVAEWAGRSLTCPCGAKVICPAGPELNDASLSDTLIETADALSASSTWHEIIEREEAKAPRRARGVAYSGRVSAAAAREANRQFLKWSLLLLLGVAMIIHAVILFPYHRTHWPFWVYASLAVLIAPLSMFKFRTAMLRWRRGRSWMQAMAESLGADVEE